MAVEGTGTVVGEAAILIRPSTAGFEAAATKDTDAALAGIEAKAGAAGVRSGKAIEEGVGGGLTKIEADMEGAGTRGGGRLASGFSRGVGGFGMLLQNTLGLPLGGIGQHIDTLNTKAAGLGDGLGAKLLGPMGVSGIIGVGAAFGVAAIAGVKMAGDFSAAEASIASAANISTKAADSIGQAMLHTAGTTEFSAQEQASAFASVAGQLTQLDGKALTTKQSMQVVNASMELATGSGADLKTAMGALAQTMLVFKVPAKDAASATDTLYNVSRITNSSVDAVAQGMTKLKARLGETAPSLADTGTLMVGMADAGFKGGRAAIATAGAFQTLLSGSKGVTSTLGALGVNVLDSSGKFVGLQSVIGQLQPKLAKMSESQRTLTLQTLFGKQAAQGLGQIVAGGAAGYDKLAASVNRVGSAHQAAALKAHTLPVEMKTFEATGKDLLVTLGQALLPTLTKLGSIVLSVAKFFLEHKAALIAFGAAVIYLVTGPLGLIITAIILVATHWKAIWGGIRDFFVGIWHEIAGAFATAWHAISGAFDAALDWIKHWGLLIVEVILAPFTGGLSLIVPFIIQHWDEVVHIFESIPGRILGALSGLWHDITGAFGDVGSWVMHNVIDPVVNFFTGLPGRIGSAIAGLFSAEVRGFGDVAGWVGSNIIGPVVNFFTGLPARVASGVGNIFRAITGAFGDVAGWVGTHIIDPIVHFFEELPGRVLKGLGNIGGAIGHAISGGLKSIPVIGSFLASGGPAIAGSPYIVGEKGPELFVPGITGTVIPNEQLNSALQAPLMPAAPPAAPRSAATGVAVAPAAPPALPAPVREGPLVEQNFYMPMSPHGVADTVGWALRVAATK